MGLGCMGMSEFYGPSTEAQAREVMEAALASGVRFFDTADVYGNGHNERLLGAYLRDHPQRSELVVATKGGIVRDAHDASRRGLDNSPGYLKDAARRSQDRLGTPIDLYYLHRIADGGRHIEDSMRAMADLLADGVIRAVGLSEADVPTICRADVALRQLTGGAHALAAVQSELSLLSRTVETQGVLRACERLGIRLSLTARFVAGCWATPGLILKRWRRMTFAVACRDFKPRPCRTTSAWRLACTRWPTNSGPRLPRWRWPGCRRGVPMSCPSLACARWRGCTRTWPRAPCRWRCWVSLTMPSPLAWRWVGATSPPPWRPTG